MFHLKLITLKGIVKDEEIKHVQVTIDNIGSFGVLKDHAPIISVIDEGYLTIDNINNETYYIKVDNAIFEMKNNIASITCEDYFISNSLEDAIIGYNQKRTTRINENKARNAELALAENELRKQIKKTGAGHI